MNPPANVPLWVSGLVTATTTVPAACAGVMAVIVVLLRTVTPVAGLPPTVAVAPATKLFPLIVMAVPPVVRPVFGDTLLIVGAGNTYVKPAARVAF